MLRKCEKSDGKSIYGLICDMENKELPYEKFEELYQQQLSREDMYGLVNFIDDNVIGFLNLRFENQLHHCEKIAEILEFAVDSRYRSKGIGKEMLAEAAKIALEHGCVQMEVACNQLRSNTHRFYEREGMHNFHYKFSKMLMGEDDTGNVLGR